MSAPSGAVRPGGRGWMLLPLVGVVAAVGGPAATGRGLDPEGWRSARHGEAGQGPGSDLGPGIGDVEDRDAARPVFGRQVPAAGVIPALVVEQDGEVLDARVVSDDREGG